MQNAIDYSDAIFSVSIRTANAIASHNCGFTQAANPNFLNALARAPRYAAYMRRKHLRATVIHSDISGISFCPTNSSLAV